MEERIINKVAESSLKVFDLEDYYPKDIKITIDIAQWLFEGFFLKEKEFRNALLNHSWQEYQNKYVLIMCSTEAVVPSWAYVLITMYLTPFAKKIFVGNSSNLDVVLYETVLAKVDFSIYKDFPVIIKGCSKKKVPLQAYVLAANYLQPFARSIMYGEACSAVPIYKKVKT